LNVWIVKFDHVNWSVVLIGFGEGL
jgi:hypothetical protein